MDDLPAVASVPDNAAYLVSKGSDVYEVYIVIQNKWTAIGTSTINYSGSEILAQDNTWTGTNAYDKAITLKYNKFPDAVFGNSVGAPYILSNNSTILLEFGNSLLKFQSLGTDSNSYNLVRPSITAPVVTVNLPSAAGTIQTDTDIAAFLTKDHTWTGSNYFPSVFIGSESAINGQITSGDEDGDLALRSVNGGIKFLFDTAPLKFWSSSSDTYDYNVQRPQINANARLILPAKSGTLATLDDLSPYMPKSGGIFTGPVTVNGDVITTGTGMMKAYTFCDSGQREWVEFGYGANWSTSFGVSGANGTIYNLGNFIQKKSNGDVKIPRNAIANAFLAGTKEVGINVTDLDEHLMIRTYYKQINVLDLADNNQIALLFSTDSFPIGSGRHVASEEWVKQYVTSPGGGGSGDATLAGNNNWTGSNYFPSVFIGSESAINGQITSGDEDGDLALRSVNGGIKFLFDTAPLKFWSSSSDAYSYNIERPKIDADARLKLPASSGTIATEEWVKTYIQQEIQAALSK